MRETGEAEDDAALLRAEAVHEVVLRPEFTAPVARMFVSRLLQEGHPDHLPLRFAYAGQVYREVAVRALRYREFRQVGVELVGAPEPLGDLEVLLLACDGAEALGLPGWRLHLGHACLYQEILEGEGLGGGRLAAISAALEQTARLYQQASGPEDTFRRHATGYLPDLLRRARGLVDDALVEALEQPDALDGDRLRKRLLDCQEQLLRRSWARDHRLDEARIERILALARLQGEPDAVLQALRKDHARSKKARATVDTLAGLARELQASRPMDLRITPAASRGIAYYTGITFELHCDATGASYTDVCGGGRYDRLHEWIYRRARLTRRVRQQAPGPELGDLDRVLRGVGLAFGVERVAAALSEGGTPGGRTVPVFVGVLDGARIPDALRLADRLRRSGVPAVAELLGPEGGQGLREQLGQASHRGCRHALLLGGSEWGRGEVILRDMAAGSQQALAPDAALDRILQGAKR